MPRDEAREKSTVLRFCAAERLSFPHVRHGDPTKGREDAAFLGLRRRRPHIDANEHRDPTEVLALRSGGRRRWVAPCKRRSTGMLSITFTHVLDALS
jgi:hypothetical protein